MHSRFVPVLVGAFVLPACAKHSSDIAPVTLGMEPRFETRAEIPTGTGMHADYAVADFSGDGDLDMVVVGLSGELQVMLGGNGATFAQGQTMTLGGAPIWIASADLDGDSDTDLAVVRTGADETSIFFNNGAADFTAGPVLPVGGGALAVVLGDANDDQITDVIVSRLVSPTIVVYVNDGDGNFTAGSGLSLPGGGQPFNMALGDVDGDAVKDLVVCDATGGRIVIWFGAGTGLDFEPVPHVFKCGRAPKAVVIGEVSGDGLTDLIVSEVDENRLYVYSNYLSGPVTGWEIPLSGSPSISTLGDATGDGVLDLVTGVMGSNAAIIAPGTAGGGLGALIHLDCGGQPLRPFVGDVDGDTRNDLLVLSGLHDHVNLWLAKADGTLAGARSYESLLPGSQTIAGGDFDGDGRNDVMVGGWGADEVVLMGTVVGATGLQRLLRIPVGRTVNRVVAADLDADAKPDLVLAVDGGVKLLRNRSIPGFLQFDVLPDAGTGVLAAGATPFGLAVADIDRDGLLDLLVADFEDGGLHRLSGTATPFTFLPAVTTNVGGGPLDVAVAEFTGDSVPDVAVSRARLADIAVLRNDGHGLLTAFTALTVHQAPTFLITGDFDRNGRADLVVSNSAAGTVSVLFARSTGFAQVTFPAGQGPTALLASDLTDDGAPDVLVTSLIDGSFMVLAGDGIGGFPLVFPFPGTWGATSAVLQDMDADAQPDVLIGSIVTDRVSMVKNISR